MSIWKYLLRTKLSHSKVITVGKNLKNFSFHHCFLTVSITHKTQCKKSRKNVCLKSKHCGQKCLTFFNFPSKNTYCFLASKLESMNLDFFGWFFDRAHRDCLFKNYCHLNRLKSEVIALKLYTSSQRDDSASCIGFPPFSDPMSNEPS